MTLITEQEGKIEILLLQHGCELLGRSHSKSGY